MASFQPPEYQAQLTFFADSRSPIVGWSRGGGGCFPVTFPGCGDCAGYPGFTIEPVARDGDTTGLRNVLRQVEWAVGDPVGEPWILDGRRLRVVDRPRQGRVRGSGTVGLPRGRTRAVDPVRTWEEAVQRVEAAVLLEDHDDVLDTLHPGCRRGRRRRARARCRHQQRGAKCRDVTPDAVHVRLL